MRIKSHFRAGKTGEDSETQKKRQPEGLGELLRAAVLPRDGNQMGQGRVRRARRGRCS